MRERSSEHGDFRDQRPGPVPSRSQRNSVPASNRERELLFARYLYSNDGSTGFNEFDIAAANISYRLTIITASGAAFLIGVEQLIVKLLGG